MGEGGRVSKILTGVRYDQKNYFGVEKKKRGGFGGLY